jgi:hypothetical protein
VPSEEERPLFMRAQRFVRDARVAQRPRPFGMLEEKRPTPFKKSAQ